MGGTNQKIQYSVPVSAKKQKQTPIYRHPDFKDQLFDGATPKIKDMKKAIMDSMQKHGNNDCLGTIIRKQGEKDTIKYLTYSQVLNQAVILGSGIIHQKLSFKPEGQNLNFIGIFSKNRIQWTILDISCILYKMTTVPLYDTLGDQSISYVLNHTQMTTIFVNDISLKALMKTKDMSKIKNIISFDIINQQQIKYFCQKGIIVRSYSQITKIGKQNIQDYRSEQYNVKPNDCLSLCYTSGTTGPPKGAKLSHNNYTSFIGGCITNKDCKFNQKDVILSYLPLPHVIERQFLYVILYSGGKIVYYSGDVSKIKDDLALVKPTVFASVPRMLSRFYDVILKRFGQLQGWTKTALDYALNTKLKNVTTNGDFTHKVYDRIFFNKTKAALGGNVRLIICGSAPLLPEVHKLLKVTMAAPLIQAYGQTQSTGACFVTYSLDPVLGHVGGPASNIQFKLVDIPQMNYTSEDKDQYGKSTPRGQLWMRGPGVFLGYYKNEDKNKQTLTQDGWLKSGDVGMILSSNKGLKIIDRKKNIFKLSQGEYVAPEKIQKVYSDYHLINEIFLTGDSTQNFAVVIVSPNKNQVLQKAKKLGLQGSFEQLCQNLKIKTSVLEQMNELGKRQGLKGFEQAKNIYIQPNSFQSRQILTDTMKIQRHLARNAYKKQISALYKQGMLSIDKQNK